MKTDKKRRSGKRKPAAEREGRASQAVARGSGYLREQCGGGFRVIKRASTGQL